MVAKLTDDRRETFMIAGDGLLLTLGAFAIGMGSAMALHAWGVAPLGEPDPTSGQFFLGLISWLLQIGGLIVGPLLAWRLHHRRFTGAAVLGALVGAPVTVAVVMAIAALAQLLGWVASPFTDSEFAGPIAVAVIVVAGIVLAAAWVLADGIQDLGGGEGRRAHVGLDIARLVGGLALVVTGVWAWALVSAGSDLEGFDIMMAGGVFGAIVVTTASLADRWQESRHESGTHAPTAV